MAGSSCKVADVSSDMTEMSDSNTGWAFSGLEAKVYNQLETSIVTIIFSLALDEPPASVLIHFHLDTHCFAFTPHQSTRRRDVNDNNIHPLGL